MYTLLSVVAEVYIAEKGGNPATVTATIIAFALSQGAAAMLFYMDLKDEPASLKLLVLIPLMFIAGLLITVVASLG
jgi:heme/copper-type cytochrome/quinol oxidase subunit 4